MNIKTGLNDLEVKKRQKKYGLNIIKTSHFSFLKAIGSRLWGFSAWILEFALVIEIFMREYVQAFFIILLLLFAALNGAFQQRKTQKLLKPLKKDLEIHTRVLRNSKWKVISAEQLVPGDIISLKQGEIIPADVQLISGELNTDESTITGESNIVTHKNKSEILSGVNVVQGAGVAEVIRTGSNSRLGKTVSLTNIKNSHQGKLQFLLSKIIHYLAILDAFLVMVLLVIVIVRHQNIIHMLPLMAILFIATIPIAMPSSFSIANSVEANVLAKKDILVSSLESIQNAANIDLLMLDKTGTLTDSNFELVNIQNFSMYTNDEILSLAKAATNKIAPSNIDKVFQDVQLPHDQQPLQIEKVIPFDVNKKYSEVHLIFDNQQLIVKLGDPAKLISPLNWYKYVKKISNKVIALTINGNLAALFEMTNHLRNGSYKTIHQLCQRAIKVLIITGDNLTATQNTVQKLKMKGHVIEASELNEIDNIKDIAAICSVLPEDKLTILNLLKNKGYVVGMTGDGMNDAPALKAADLGIATSNAVDLAKQSAGVIMQKEGISSIIDILDSGHRVYQRMMTWTITKLSRTAQLSILLTIGYWIANFIPINLNAIVLIAILNDLVTMVLGTDNVQISTKPEQWNMKKLIKISMIFTVSWVLSGMILFIWMNKVNILSYKVSTIMFLFLIDSAMLTILMTRTRKFFLRGHPSKMVLTVIIINYIFTSVLAISGHIVFPISWKLVVLILIGTLLFSIVIDIIKVYFYQNVINE